MNCLSTCNYKWPVFLIIAFLVASLFFFRTPCCDEKDDRVNNISCFFYHKKCYFDGDGCESLVYSCKGLKHYHPSSLDMVISKKSRDSLFYWSIISIRASIILIIFYIINNMIFDFMSPIWCFIRGKHGKKLVYKLKFLFSRFILLFLVFMTVPIILDFIFFVA